MALIKTVFFAKVIVLQLVLFIDATDGCAFDTSCKLEYYDSKQQHHCIENQCMSFIREPCDDGIHCYNNIAQSSFGTECIQDVDAEGDADANVNDKVCKVLTGNMCNHDVDCAVESDICVDQKCTTSQCNCASYQDCVDYECKSKSCSATPDCSIEGASRSSSASGDRSRSDAAFCFDNYCRPLASFGGQCGISSDCGEKKASCIGGICAVVAEKAKEAAIQKEVSDADDEHSSFGTGFIAGFLAASFIGFGIYFEYKTQSISECLRNGRRNIHTGMIAVPAVAVELEGEVISATSKQIQLSAIT